MAQKSVPKTRSRIVGCVTGRLQQQSGFTLIELMITVTIVAILTLIALPAYQDQMRKTRRTDAKTALTEIANREEKFFSNNSPPHYTGTITSAWPSGLGYTSALSPDGYYDLQITLSGSGYTAQATAKASGPQASDTGCLTMSIDSGGTRLPATGCW